jgi:cell division protein FtsN
MASDAGRGGAVPVEAPKDTVKRDTAVTVKAPGRYTLQIAAYKSKDEADVVAKHLKARKLDARVVPSGKLFRVRIGRYATRGAAQAAQRELKAKKIDAIIAEIGPDDKP